MRTLKIMKSLGLLVVCSLGVLLLLILPAQADSPVVQAVPVQDSDTFDDDEDWGDVEEVAAEAVAVVSRSGLSASGSKSAGFLDRANIIKLVGYMHSAATHLPVGWLILLVLLNCAQALGRAESVGITPRLVTVLTLGLAAVFLPAVMTGLARGEVVGFNDDVIWHRNVMLGASLLVMIVAASEVMVLRGKRGLPHKIILPILGLALIVVTLGAHAGGVMVFGELPLP